MYMAASRSDFFSSAFCEVEEPSSQDSDNLRTLTRAEVSPTRSLQVNVPERNNYHRYTYPEAHTEVFRPSTTAVEVGGGSFRSAL